MKVENVTEGKYYRTELLVTLDDGRMVSVELSSSDPEPSIDEIAAWGSRREFDEECCDGHYEREATWIVANAIVGALRHG